MSLATGHHRLRVLLLVAATAFALMGLIFLVAPVRRSPNVRDPEWIVTEPRIRAFRRVSGAGFLLLAGITVLVRRLA